MKIGLLYDLKLFENIEALIKHKFVKNDTLFCSKFEAIIKNMGQYMNTSKVENLVMISYGQILEEMMMPYKMLNIEIFVIKENIMLFIIYFLGFIFYFIINVKCPKN